MLERLNQRRSKGVLKGIMMANPLRQRVIYQGRVQGVGFRYTTTSIARRFPVVGFVRNLPDGSVELVAEADSQTLTQFLDEVASAFAGNIRTQQASEFPRDEPLTTFEIRR